MGGGVKGKKENIQSTSWVPKAISQAAKSSPSPCLSIFLCPAGRSDSAAGQTAQNLALPQFWHTPTEPRLALSAQEEGACLPGTQHRQQRWWIEVAPPELTRETCGSPSGKGRGVGSPERLSRYRPLCATSGRRRGWRGHWRWRVPQCFAATRCPEPARSPLPGSWSRQQPRGQGGGGGVLCEMSRGPSARLRTHFPARSRPIRGSYWSFLWPF